jgi:lysophospholipase L1-like esterase
MRIRGIGTIVIAAIGLFAAAQVPAQAAQATKAPYYYVALGDSLSQGYQPGLGNTNQGYVDDVYASLKTKDPSLKLAKLGCSGETTTTMIKGGICTYQGFSGQLAAAEAFLRSHRGHVKYVTFDIGANNVDGCLAGGTIDTSCVFKGVATIGVELPQITAGLRLAAGAGPEFEGMTYYDPFLAAWLLGSSGQSAAEESVLLGDGLNTLESTEYKVSGFGVADVAGQFDTNDFGGQVTLPNGAKVPTNVSRICAWTYMCSLNNIHANAAGYSQIALAFESGLSSHH